MHRFLRIICTANRSCQRRCRHERNPPRAVSSSSRRGYPRATKSATHIAPFQRLLERRIAPYGISRGQWYFLRVLWITDGLSQRELSARVGMMEPTTVIALRSMERAGLIRRVRGVDDRRKVRVYVTAKAKRLCYELLTEARRITEAAEQGVGARELAVFRRVITRMTANLDRIER